MRTTPGESMYAYGKAVLREGGVVLIDKILSFARSVDAKNLVLSKAISIDPEEFVSLVTSRKNQGLVGVLNVEPPTPSAILATVVNG